MPRVLLATDAEGNAKVVTVPSPERDSVEGESGSGCDDPPVVPPSLLPRGASSASLPATSHWTPSLSLFSQTFCDSRGIAAAVQCALRPVSAFSQPLPIPAVSWRVCLTLVAAYSSFRRLLARSRRRTAASLASSPELICSACLCFVEPEHFCEEFQAEPPVVNAGSPSSSADVALLVTGLPGRPACNNSSCFPAAFRAAEFVQVLVARPSCRVVRCCRHLDVLASCRCHPPCANLSEPGRPRKPLARRLSFLRLSS